MTIWSSCHCKIPITFYYSYISILYCIFYFPLKGVGIRVELKKKETPVVDEVFLAFSPTNTLDKGGISEIS